MNIERIWITISRSAFNILFLNLFSRLAESSNQTIVTTRAAKILAPNNIPESNSVGFSLYIPIISLSIPGSKPEQTQQK